MEKCPFCNGMIPDSFLLCPGCAGKSSFLGIPVKLVDLNAFKTEEEEGEDDKKGKGKRQMRPLLLTEDTGMRLAERAAKTPDIAWSDLKNGSKPRSSRFAARPWFG